mmetsp:Transcript_42065/g.75296  ORF Transcript_42065/g.75296 Transcript_42065/m.75296 type:complete len:89 (-) Transcript_42065:812-1078(-)
MARPLFGGGGGTKLVPLNTPKVPTKKMAQRLNKTCMLQPTLQKAKDPCLDAHQAPSRSLSSFVRNYLVKIGKLLECQSATSGIIHERC